MKKNKLALGTVQFGMSYGINNKSSVPTTDEVMEILEFASNHDVLILDTAEAYGDAETKLGQGSLTTFKIVTKFGNLSQAEELSEHLNGSLKRLNLKSVYGYLAHNAGLLIENPDIWKKLEEEKAKGRIERIGFSLYSVEQLEELLGLNMSPDLVQLPYSLLDRKFESFFPILKQIGTEIHTRSAFLQGLYFLDPEALPDKLLPLKENLIELKNTTVEFKIPMEALALNFALINPLVDAVVIGVDNLHQLKSNVEMVMDGPNMNSAIEKVGKIKVKDKNLLNPHLWN